MMVKSYTEKGFQDIGKVFLTDEEYERALRTFVIMCTDIIIVDFAKRTIFLAKRKAKPIVGWWYVGGRMQATETKEESVRRCFFRETGVDLNEEKFKLVAVLDQRFKDRQQSPQTIGCHTCSFVFTLSVVDVAVETIRLDLDEYESYGAFKEFSRESLVENEVFGSIIDVYDSVFPDN